MLFLYTLLLNSYSMGERVGRVRGGMSMSAEGEYFPVKMVFGCEFVWKMTQVQEKPSLCEGLFCYDNNNLH